MARMIDPDCKLCRREGVKLFLKGTRCDTPKCAIERRAKPPGQHGDRRIRMTDFGLHLRETQKAKRAYGVLQRQFTRYFDVALSMPGNTGENLLILLERRLDNVIFRLGFATSRSQARQFIRHGHITVNGRRVTIPSYGVKAGDVISPIGHDRSKKVVAECLKISNKDNVPSWLKLQESPAQGTVVQIPTRSEVVVPLNEQLIIEFMSR